MAISTYSELQTEMANRSARSDLTTYLPNMIVLAEARMLRDLKDSQELHTTTTLTVDAQTIALPANFGGMVRIRLGSDYPTLDYLAPDEFHSTEDVDNSGRPIYYTIEGNNLLVAPAPDQSFTATYTYVEKLDLATDTTNRLITIYPDVYVWSSMAELADFIQDDAMIARYMARYEMAVNSMLEAKQAIGTPVIRNNVP